MNSLTLIKIDGHRYFLFNEIVQSAPSLLKGLRNGREYIRHHNLTPIDEYIFASLSNDSWIQSDGKSKKMDKVFLRKSYVESIKTIVSNKPKYDLAPDVIELYEKEKFHDDQGNIYEIETRGSRNVDDIYFRVKDVAKAFNLKQLNASITNKDRSYKINVDYKYFYLTDVSTDNDKQIKKSPKLFLTYIGLLKVLFTSRNNKTNPFIKWATNTLFTAHLGTPSQKKQLASDMLGISIVALKEAFNTNTRSLPCVYFFILGCVKDLRQSMKISDDYDDLDIVGMFGYTIDLVRRSNEHKNDYSKINGCDLRLKYYSYVDPQFLSKAETDVKSCMDALDVSFSYKKEKELVIIPKKKLKFIKDRYSTIGEKYSGHHTELIKELNDLKAKLKTQDLEHKLELANERHKSEIADERHKREILEKDLEIALLKNDQN